LEILKVHTKTMPLEGVELDELAEELDGYTGADIEGLAREAAMIALRENKNARKVTMAQFQEATKVVRPSLDEETIKFYERLGRDIERGAARRQKEEVLGYYR
jgi:transitional endoplasmic reticulum ATPase